MLADSQDEIAQMPAVMRALITAELAAGNRILEVGHSFPAPPAGLYVMLAAPVSTRPRTSDSDLSYYERNSSSYSVEWHDDRRFYFILEPPLPPPPEPDMEAVRAALAGGVASSDAIPTTADTNEGDDSNPSGAASPRPAAAHPVDAAPGSPLARFIESMRIDYERWREGIGFDLEAIDAASPDERAAIEQLLLPDGARGWREVEALARLGSPRAHTALRDALRRGNAEVRAAVVRHAPQLVDEATRTESLVRGLREATLFAGLSQMLDDAAVFHPPAVVDVLFREARHGPGDKAVHLAALLYHIHGLTEHRFDWDHRPFFLRFNSTDSTEREAAFAELCAAVGVDPARYR